MKTPTPQPARDVQPVVELLVDVHGILQEELGRAGCDTGQADFLAQPLLDRLAAHLATHPEAIATLGIKPDFWGYRDDPECSQTDPSEFAACGEIDVGEIAEVTPFLALPPEWLACRHDEEGTMESETFPTKEAAQEWIAASPFVPDAALAQPAAGGDGDGR